MPKKHKRSFFSSLYSCVYSGLFLSVNKKLFKSVKFLTSDLKTLQIPQIIINFKYDNQKRISRNTA